MSDFTDNKKIDYTFVEDDEPNKNDEEKEERTRKIRKWIEETESSKQDEDEMNGNDNDKSIIEKKGKFYPKDVANQITFERSKISRIGRSSAEYARSATRLNYLEKLPWIPEVFEPVDVEKARKFLDEEHFGMNDVKNEIIEYIYAINKMGAIGNEIILLTGPPGTGKTTIARRIAKTLGRDLYKTPLGGLSDEVFIRGAAQQYAGSKPGAIIEALFKTRHRKLVILLDEIDKFGTRNGSPEAASALLDALDRDNAFVDRFIGLPIDLSDIIFIATANEDQRIPSALYDRMTKIEIMPYSKEEKIEICNRYLLPKSCETYGVEKSLRIDQKVIRHIVEEDYKNAGIRGIEKKIGKICRIASMEMVKKGTKTYMMSVKRAIGHGLISSQKVGFINEYRPGKTITSGIDYTNGKESLVPVEALFVDRMQEAEVVGQKEGPYGDDLTRLWSCIFNDRDLYGLNEKKVMEGAFVLNVEKMAYFNYDPNQRLAVAFAMLSALMNVVLPKKHVVIGDVSLLGVVTANSRTKNHIINAAKSGAEVYFVPNSLAEKTRKLVTGKEVRIFGISDLRDLSVIMKRLYVLDKINNKIEEQGSVLQTNINVLIEHEKKILEISRHNNWPLKKVFDI